MNKRYIMIVDIVCNPPPQLFLEGAFTVGEEDEAYLAQFTASGGVQPYVYSIFTGALPSGLTIDRATGVVSGTTADIGSFPVTVAVTDALGQVATVTDTLIVEAGPEPITISGTISTTAQYSAASSTLTIAGGVPPYVSVAVVSGTAPTGMTFNISGSSILVAGTVTSSGSYTFTLRVTDSDGATGVQAFSTTVTPPAAITITGSIASVPKYDTASSTLTIAGGISPYVSVSVVSGTAPTGMTFNISGSSVLVGGAVTANVGSYSFTLRVTDNVGGTGDQAFSATVSTPTPITAQDWRILVQANNGHASFNGVGQWLLFTAADATPTQPEAISTSGATITVSSQVNSSNSGAEAFNANTSNGWLSANLSSPSWLRIHYASPVTVVQHTLGPAGNTDTTTNPISPQVKDFTIQYSTDNGANWNTWKVVTGETSWPSTSLADRKSYLR